MSTTRNASKRSTGTPIPAERYSGRPWTAAPPPQTRTRSSLRPDSFTWLLQNITVLWRSDVICPAAPRTERVAFSPSGFR